MRKFTFPVTLIFVLSVLLVAAAPGMAAGEEIAVAQNGSQPFVLSKLPPGTFPYFYIEAVKVDESVTIKGYNFPANDTFNVLMGDYGTLGVGGTKVTTQSTGAGGSFMATYSIPASQKGKTKIAIRLESPTSGYFAYNWFTNAPAAASTTPTKTATPAPPTPATPTATKTPAPAQPVKTFPYFFIDAVVKNDSVTIKAYNFPADDTFNVTMGLMGTKGIKGTLVGTQASGSGGSFTATYKIPTSLLNQGRIAIRLESPKTGYYAFNWFYNNSTAEDSAPVTTPKPATSTQDNPSKPPVFFIKAVVRNNTVTIEASNFPKNETFQVLMGKYGTKGVNGVVVGTQDSGNGKFTATYTIPASLANSNQIAIRLQSTSSPYYSYNWFYNNTTP